MMGAVLVHTEAAAVVVLVLKAAAVLVHIEAAAVVLVLTASAEELVYYLKNLLIILKS